jgi:hypothetical protein
MPATARRVYSAQELHRLRDSSSQPRLHEAIEQHDGEDAEIVKGTFDTEYKHTYTKAVHHRALALNT